MVQAEFSSKQDIILYVYQRLFQMFVVALIPGGKEIVHVTLYVEFFQSKSFPESRKSIHQQKKEGFLAGRLERANVYYTWDKRMKCIERLRT